MLFKDFYVDQHDFKNSALKTSILMAYRFPYFAQICVKARVYEASDDLKSVEIYPNGFSVIPYQVSPLPQWYRPQVI